MSAWDPGAVTTAGARRVALDVDRRGTTSQSRLSALDEFTRFLRTFQEDNIYIYREALVAQYRRGDRVIEVDLQHVAAYASQLHDLLLEHPNEYLPVFEEAAHRCLVGLLGDRATLEARDRALEAVLKPRGGGGAGGRSAEEEGDEEEDEEEGKSEEAGGGVGGDVARAALDEKQAQLAAEAAAARTRELEARVPRVQVTLVGEMAPTTIRGITARSVNRLVLVPGMVVSASRARPRVHRVCIRCTNCDDTRMLPVHFAQGGFRMPRTCLALRPSATSGAGNPGGVGSCGLDPYVVVADRCEYQDSQLLKLQEAPEEVPTGEMPRHTQLSVDRALVDRVAPGTRVSALGVVSILSTPGGGPGGSGPGALGGGGRGAEGGEEGAAGVRRPILRVVGLVIRNDGAGRAVTQFKPEEEAEFRAFAASGAAFERLAASVAPAIAGDYARDIKRAIACLLLGGSRKLLRDGMRIRGDINVLLLGDPSTAKSQFLKFAERAAPVGVYTSGKGSSAAGLTASVTRDQRGEFYLEGGAMVLADGGVVCIDEFDKMREEDRVAIHEAMEQQTISVAKAGITTILNSRAAVLAAANPVFGRYDDDRSAAENIDFLPTILSRFDLIFIVRDVREVERDRAIARAVMDVHVNAGAEDPHDEESAGFGAAGVGGAAGAAGAAAGGGELDLDFLRRYIAFARETCAPRLSPSAVTALRDQWVDVRKKQRERRHAATSRPGAAGGAGAASDDSVIPITVRQLEALARIAEAVAKARLSPEVTEADAREAIRLFSVSTLDATTAGLGKHFMTPELAERVRACEDKIRQTVAVGASASTERLKKALRLAFSDTVIANALAALRGHGDVAAFSEGRMLRRVK